MKNRHKYFRNLRYKQKLESKYDNRDYSWCRISFLTKEPDPRYAREYMFKWIYHTYCRYKGMTVDELIERRLEEFRNDKARGHDYYEYYDRPEVPYTIKEWTDRPYGKKKKFYKKYTTRILRHTEEVYNHSQYKKVFDLWWTID